MAVWIKEFRARVGKLEDKGKYSSVNLSVSEKNKDGDYVFSDFSFVRFFGEAHEFAQGLQEGDVITVTSCKITKQAYMDKDGKKQYPKSDSWNVFKAEMYKAKSNGKSGTKAETKVETEVKETASSIDEDEFPF